MQVGISTASFFTNYQTEDTLELIAGLGSTRYEAFLSGFLEYEKDFIAEMKKRQQMFGLSCTALHTLGSQFEPQLFSIVDRQRQGAEYMFSKTLECAAELNAPLYVMHGLFFLKRGGFVPNYKRWGDCFYTLCELAASFGVRLTLENVHWCMYAKSGLAKILEPYLKDCWLGYTLDVKQAMQSGDAIEAYVQDMGERLCNVHLCGVFIRDEQAYTCLPGQGQVDFASLAEMVAKQNPKASVTLEVYAPDYRSLEELKQSYTWLCKLFAAYE